jgi:hypothetical protein
MTEPLAMVPRARSEALVEPKEYVAPLVALLDEGTQVDDADCY